MLEIDQTQLDPSLLVVNKDGSKSLDLTKIKTQTDVDNVMKAKQHANEQLAALRSKFANVDVDRYNTLIAKQMEQNRDILSNSVYKHLEGQFSTLQKDYEALKGQLLKRDEAIIDSQLKDQIRNFKGIQPSAVDDILYHVKNAGYKKTEKGFLDTNGNNLETFMSKLQNEKAYLFKRTVGLRDEEKFTKMQQAYKNNNLREVLANCPTKTI